MKKIPDINQQLPSLLATALSDISDLHSDLAQKAKVYTEFMQHAKSNISTETEHKAHEMIESMEKTFTKIATSIGVIEGTLNPVVPMMVNELKTFKKYRLEIFNKLNEFKCNGGTINNIAVLYNSHELISDFKVNVDDMYNEESCNIQDFSTDEMIDTREYSINSLLCKADQTGEFIDSLINSCMCLQKYCANMIEYIKKTTMMARNTFESDQFTEDISDSAKNILNNRVLCSIPHRIGSINNALCTIKVKYHRVFEIINKLHSAYELYVRACDVATSVATENYMNADDIIIY